jgi:hypothetical protein
MADQFDSPAGATEFDWEEVAKAFQGERDQLQADLAECYRLTGSDPDGAPDSMLAKHAVQAVRELREECDQREDSGLQVEKLLSAVEAHAAEWDESYLPDGPDRRTETMLARIWDDDQKLYAAADQVRKEREDG